MKARPAVLLGLAGLALATAASAAGPDRSKPPSASAPRPVRLPPVQRLALGNGLPVTLVELREVPVLELLLIVRAGGASDAAGRGGVACLTAEMLDEGSGGRDALAIADAIDLLGAELETSCDWEEARVRLHVPVARLGVALSTFADVALRPAFRQKDLDRLRREALTDLLQARDEPRRVASFALARAVFGDSHRYGQPLRGDAAALQAIKASDLRGLHNRLYRPDNAALIAVGAIDAAALLPQLEKAFGAWQKGGQPAAPLPEPAPLAGRELWLVDRPGAAQSVVRLGRPGPPRASADHHALEVLNTLLGGSFTSRLNDNLRERNGYAYGASSRFDYRASGGLFLAASDVHTPASADAVREMVSELERMRTAASKEEIERARAFLAAGYARGFETTRQVADRLAEQYLYGLPEDEFLGFVPKALAVDAKAVQRLAPAVDAATLAIVIVGDRARIEKGLQGLNLGEIRTLTVEQVMGPPPAIAAPPKPEQ